MNSLKELLDKIYKDIQGSDIIKEYPEYSDRKLLGYELESIALDIMPDFVSEDKKEEFIDACEKSYNEVTFKEYIPNYQSFLKEVEGEFYEELKEE